MMVDFYCMATNRQIGFLGKNEVCNALLISIPPESSLDVEIECPRCGARSRVYQNVDWFGLRVPREDT